MKILFVCSGNTCRSPMAQLIMQDLALKKGFKKNKLEVLSAGIVGPAGLNISKGAVNALKKLGIKAGVKKSHLIDDYKLGDFDYIITMTNYQKQKINLSNCYSIFDFCGFEIPDPFLQPQEVYDKMAIKLKTACEKILEKIKGEDIWFV